ncbi:MAG TPA: plasmid pRiA4b ORF-3 family protein [Candidatus Limnocylindrales bacterium]
MGTASTGDDLGTAARLARECTVMRHAAALAGWIGAGQRRVTAGRVLRRPDVPAAGALLGVRVPARVRTAADVRELHRPWCLAVALGLLRIDAGMVTAEAALESSEQSDADVLEGWLAGLRAVCAAESRPDDEDSVRLLARALLIVLAGADTAPPGRALWAAVREKLDALCDLHDKSSWEPLHAAGRYYDLEADDPLAGLVTLLAGFGAVAATPGGPAITRLGGWAAGRICADMAALASPRLTAAELITEFARFADEEQQWHVAWGWLAERDPSEAAWEILAAAEQASPLQRFRAVRVTERLGGDSLPAWRELAAAPCVGPHARAALASMNHGPEPDDADRRWLAAEAAAAALEDKGPDEALSCVTDAMPGDCLGEQLASVLATGHPGARELARSVTEFAASGAPRSSDQVVQLKVSLQGMRPPIWRRVQVPATATLGDLHEVIQVAYGWDGDHLHVFRVGKKSYSDPFVGLDGARDEEEPRLGELAASGAGKISYTYDLGACWQHEITLEGTRERELMRNYPVCAEFSGDSPEEYPPEEHGSGDSNDEPTRRWRFSLADVNRELAALGLRGG